jgi:hypothetical protein
MFSSVGCPALVPILIPGGIGRIVAELEPAEASKTAPPIATLANSRFAGLYASGLLILELRTDELGHAIEVGAIQEIRGNASVSPGWEDPAFQWSR